MAENDDVKDDFIASGEALDRLLACVDELEFLTGGGTPWPDSVARIERDEDTAWADPSVPLWPHPVSLAYEVALRSLAVAHDHLLGTRDLLVGRTTGTGAVTTLCRVVLEAAARSRWILTPSDVKMRVGRGMSSCAWALERTASADRRLGERLTAEVKDANERRQALWELGHLRGLATTTLSKRGKALNVWTYPMPNSSELCMDALGSAFKATGGAVYPVLSESAHGNPGVISRLTGRQLWESSGSDLFVGRRRDEHRIISGLLLAVCRVFVDTMLDGLRLVQADSSPDRVALMRCWGPVEKELRTL